MIKKAALSLVILFAFAVSSTAFEDVTTYIPEELEINLTETTANLTNQSSAPIAEQAENASQGESFFSAASGKLVSAADWSFRNNFVRIGVPVFIVVVALLIYLFNRDAPSNNLRKARKHHKLSERYHERGKEDKARKHYELAQLLREKGVQ